jgi:hypothetical protein
MNLPWSKTRLGVAAGIVAGSAGLALVSGLGPAQSLLPIASARGADDSPSTTVDDRGNDAVTTTVPGTTLVPGTTRVVDAAGAGTVTIAVGDNDLQLIATTPAAGWTGEVEQAAGNEIEVDFRRGGERVQVNVEIEDGAVRERIRIRDDAGTDIRIENGVIVRADEPDARDDDDRQGDDDNSGPGSANSGPGSLNSGHGDDDPAGDDHGGVEPGDDHGDADEPGDDHGGDRVDNSGSGRGGADDPAGDDHGGDD